MHNLKQENDIKTPSYLQNKYVSLEHDICGFASKDYINNSWTVLFSSMQIYNCGEKLCRLIISSGSLTIEIIFSLRHRREVILMYNFFYITKNISSNFYKFSNLTKVSIEAQRDKPSRFCKFVRSYI